MTGDHERQRRAEAAVRACYATWAGSYFDDYFADASAYPPVHQAILKDELLRAKPAHLLDAGCGPASMLRSLTDIGAALYGFDLTPEMVAEARRVMAPYGVPEAQLWEGSVADPAAYRVAGGGPDLFDAAICIGVLPHVPAELDSVVMANLRQAVRPGGLVAVEARNQLFALFTLNRYSLDLFRNTLIREDDLRAAAGEDAAGLDLAMAELDGHFRADLPPLRRGKADEPGYDEVLSRTHNPVAMKDSFAAAGFRDVELLFYHYHCLPPMLERHMPELFRRQSLAMEDPRDWRGYFMASAFILIGRRA